MIVRVVITVLCGVGLYAAVFMLHKTRRAEQGLLSEPSVVQTPRARLVGGLSNALIGCIYYPAVAAAAWLAPGPLEHAILLGAVSLGAAVSIVLAYSLLRVTRMSCPYCWTAHAVNWLLLLGVLVLLRQ